MSELESQHFRLLRLQAFTEALALALSPVEIARVCDALGGIVITIADSDNAVGLGGGLEGAFGSLVNAAIQQNTNFFEGTLAIIPLSMRKRVEGALIFTLEADSDDDRAMAVAMAHQCSLALERCALFRNEADARQRMGILQRVTAGLARSFDLRQARDAIVDVLADAFGCAVLLCDVIDDSADLGVVGSRGIGDKLRRRWERFSPGLPGPVRQALEKCQPVVYRDAEAWHAAWTDRRQHIDDSEYEGAAVVPIYVDGEGDASLVILRFVNPFEWNQAWVDLLLSISVQCGQARGRARLREAEQTARNNLGFLLEASRLLSSSLDLSTTLQALTSLIVPRLADRCAIELGDGESRVPQAAATQHRAPSQRPHASPFSEDGFVSGVYENSVDRTVASASADGSVALDVPLLTPRGRLGTMRFSLIDANRRFTPADVELAGEIATRVSTAIVNARRHEELEAARNDLHRALQAKDEFLALFGHELRNPLMPITTAIELMELRGVVGAERERAVIGRQARHLVRLVDDLLDVTRITRGRVTLQQRAVEIATVLGRALETASPAIERGQHKLIFDVDPVGHCVIGDEDRLVQVFANLVQNAAKYTSDGGTVHVTAEVVGNEIIVHVVDSGRGMPVDLVPQVFDLFVQGPRTLDRAEGGLGLGLAIVKNLVELHGGRVWATSAGIGHGSTFSVALPRVEAAPTAPRASRALTPRRRRPVLIVDDNEDLAGELAAAFEALGQDVFVAYDGDAALAELDELAGAGIVPALAVVDVGLPVMDGFELCAHLRKRNITAVALSGYGQEKDRARALDAGFVDLLVKPVSIAGLADLLDRTDAKP
jgi:signal transduction histidine kinase/ActR/RegA family two-component response regulator